jgi:hypothetical protein
MNISSKESLLKVGLAVAVTLGVTACGERPAKTPALAPSPAVVKVLGETVHDVLNDGSGPMKVGYVK